MSHAIPQAPGTRKTEPCRNTPPLHVAWIRLEDYEQSAGRTLGEITALLDRAVELENSLESRFGPVVPLPLDIAYQRSCPTAEPSEPPPNIAAHDGSA